MTPEEAAALLGVDPAAGESAVRCAFRSRARAAHPDSGGSAVDLAALTEARDVLLSPPARAAGPDSASSAHPTASARPTVSASTPRSPAGTAPTPAGGSFGHRLYGAISATIALFFIGLFVLIVVAVAIGSGADGGDTPTPTAGECLIVSGEVVAESSCDAVGAQRIVAEYTGARTCPAGSNSLVVGSTTWCLEPAAP